MEVNTDMPVVIGPLPLTPAIDGGRGIGDVTTGMAKCGFAAAGEDNNRTVSLLKCKKFLALYAKFNIKPATMAVFFMT